MFARASGVVRIVEQHGRARLIACGLECTVRQDKVLVLRSTLVDIGLHEKLSPRFEQACHFVQKNFAHKKTLVVPLFPPRIGKEYKGATHAVIGTKAPKCEARVLTKHTRPGGMPSLRKVLIASGRPFFPDFKAKQRGLRHGHGALDKKPGFGARADFNLEPRAADNGRELDACSRFRGRKTWRVFVWIGTNGANGHETAPIDVHAEAVKVCYGAGA